MSNPRNARGTNRETPGTAYSALEERPTDAESNELFDLSVLHNVSMALASTMDLDELLSIVIEQVNRALLAEGAGVLLYDEHRGDLYWRQVSDSRSILAPQSESLRLPLDGSIAGWVFQNNKPARVNDTSQDSRYYPEMSRRSGFDIRKVLQVPLATRDRTIGVLSAMNKIGGDFSTFDERLLVAMAASIALAIENAAMYDKLKKSRDHLEMVYRSSLALAGTMDLDHLLSVVLSELRSALDTEAAAVLLHDEVQDDLYWRAVADAEGLINRQLRELRFPLDGSVSGKVFQTGEPALVNDPAAHPLLFRPFEIKTGFVVRNLIIAPLHTREKTIGVLLVLNRHGGRFVDYDVQLLAAMAGVVALAIENTSIFEEMVASYRDLEHLNRVKSKVLNHLSHELRTPLAIIKGTVVTMWRKLKDQANDSFDRPLQRIARHLHSLNRLESQVESIMMSGYAWEKRYITGFLQAALELMDVQAEYTPQIREAAAIIHQWLEKTFPTRQDAPERINASEFGDRVFAEIRERARALGRTVTLQHDLQPDADLMLPSHVLWVILEGLVRNAIEATPDHGLVQVSAAVKGDRYLLSVKDTGIGIPDKDKELIFQGFYPVQETQDYTSGQPYCFNAGGKGIDLLRIRMFSELYAFRLSFTSRRCPHLEASPAPLPGDASSCAQCAHTDTCDKLGGSEFLVDFPLADSKAAQELLKKENR
jgi:GAF domain-containing protein